jgi:HPt (histidine-containing phosphotransfer) domain-containing protein
LRTFIAQHGHDDEAIGIALSAPDINLATHLAHALKGASGTLGLSKIHLAATCLNDELRYPGTHQAPATLLLTLASEMQTTLQPLRSLLDEEHQPS